jgi:hypothetical protein
MNQRSFAEALLVAFGMAAWPILGKYSQAGSAWVGTTVMLGTAIAVAALAAGLGGFGNTPVPSGRAFLLLAAASLANGAAMYIYTRRANTASKTGAYLVLVAVLVVLEAPIIDLVLNKSTLTAKEWLGVACGIICVYLLSPK